MKTSNKIRALFVSLEPLGRYCKGTSLLLTISLLVLNKFRFLPPIATILVASTQADFPQGQGLLPEFAAMTNEARSSKTVLFFGEILMEFLGHMLLYFSDFSQSLVGE